MRYFMALVLVVAALLGLTSLTASVGATVTVSGETRLVSPNNPKVNPKAKYIILKRQILVQIARARSKLVLLDTQIKYLEKKIEARVRGGFDNTLLQKRLNVFIDIKSKTDELLSNLIKKLGETEDAIIGNIK